MSNTSSTKKKDNASSDWDWLVQEDRVHRLVYTDENIFAKEMDNVFAGTWVYLLHESQIAEPDDYRLAWIGTREVIVSRNEDGGIQVFSNRCTHRGARVCRENSGNSQSFTCPYHGWRFKNNGNLFGIPGKNAYGPAFKSREMNLARPAQVASYKGFIFATLNPDAPSLLTHLGNATRYMDEWIEHQGGEDNIIISGGHRYHVDCNWKLVYDNAGDGYHVPFSHQSLLVMTNERYGGGDMTYFADADRSNMHVYALENGHSVIDQRPDMFANSAWNQQRPQPGRESYVEHVLNTAGSEGAKAVLESTVGAGMNLSIFPNLLFLGNQVQVIQPLKVDSVNVCFNATRRRDADVEMNTMRLRTQEDFPIVGEMDDAANFEECQRGLTISPEDEWVDISRHYETGKDVEGDSVITGPVTSDLHQRNYYAQWKSLMKANPSLEVRKEKLK